MLDDLREINRRLSTRRMLFFLAALGLLALWLLASGCGARPWRLGPDTSVRGGSAAPAKHLNRTRGYQYRNRP